MCVIMLETLEEGLCLQDKYYSDSSSSYLLCSCSDTYVDALANNGSSVKSWPGWRWVLRSWADSSWLARIHISHIRTAHPANAG